MARSALGLVLRASALSIAVPLRVVAQEPSTPSWLPRWLSVHRYRSTLAEFFEPVLGAE